MALNRWAGNGLWKAVIVASERSRLLKLGIGQTDYHRGATVPPGKHRPLCDQSNLRPPVIQELALFSCLSVRSEFSL